MTIVTIIIIFEQISQTNQCILDQYLLSMLALGVIFHFNALILMWTNLYLGIKFAHFGSNIVWPLMWFMEINTCGSKFLSFIAIVHAVFSVIGFLTFVVLHLMSKSSFTASCWRKITIISIVMMVICYLVILLFLLIAPECNSVSYFVISYQRFGLIELLSPILILMFMRTESGDPREKVIKRHHDVFVKAKETDHDEFEQK